MSDPKTISHLTVGNFLSLQKLDLSFGPLNVLVGPNGAGKTNILKVFQFLGDVARLDLTPAIDEFGGFDDLYFRGTDNRRSIQRTISISLKGVITKYASQTAPDEYKLRFWQRDLHSARHGEKSIPHRRMVQRSEDISFKRTAGRGRRITLTGSSLKVEDVGRTQDSKLPPKLSVQQTSSGLATLRKLGTQYNAEQVEELAQVFEQLRLFEIDVDRIRRPSQIIESERLRPDASNLVPFLRWMRESYAEIYEQICEDVRFVLPGFDTFIFSEIGGADDAIRLDIREKNLRRTTPLARASFGTIRSIALFAMLHDPDPPKLTCIEEIDHGLHPHALDRLVDRLRDASASTQILLATHSPALVNRLEPNELIIVERDEDTGATRAFQPDKQMVDGLSDTTGYQLGELWFSGTLGGGLG